MHIVIGILLALVGLINFAPIMGIIGAERLGALYAYSFEDPNLVLLMRHRAVLFGLVGGFIFYSIHQPSLQPLAMGAALISMLSFIVLGVTDMPFGDFNAAIRKVMWVDVVGLVLLGGAIVLSCLQGRAVP
ncbi:MAG: hypothetical protein KUG59_00930 [Parvibaculaceae bacterium]|nr:hypothetical protein [Parvibaculaceae bacterium]